MNSPKVSLQRLDELIAKDEKSLARFRELVHSSIPTQADEMLNILRDYKRLRESLASARDALEAGARAIDVVVDRLNTEAAQRGDVMCRSADIYQVHAVALRSLVNS